MADRGVRVLLAWEFGAGLTHALHLREIARRVLARGGTAVATLVHQKHHRIFREIGVPCLQAYTWPGLFRYSMGWDRPDPQSFSDMLGNWGYHAPTHVAGMIAHYDTLFDLFRPDVVATDAAWGAALAARGRHPVVTVTTGGNQPPPERAALPFRPDGDVTWTPEDVLAGVNAGLAATGRPPLERFVDIVTTARTFVLTIPELDSLGPRADARYLGPTVGDYRPDFERAPTGEIFVYIHSFTQTTPGAMDWLEALAPRLRVVMPGILPETVDRLTAAGARVHDRVIPPADIVRNASLAIHHGGPQMTSLLAAYGIPQVLLTKEAENVIVGRHFAGEGVARHRPLAETTLGWLEATLAELETDPGVAAALLRAAPRYRSMLDSDPMSIVVDEIERLGLEARARREAAP